MNATTKTCTRCYEAKPLSEFYRRSKSKDGLMYDCKDCVKARATGWYATNRDRAQQTRRDWHHKNKDQVRAYREQNKEHIRNRRAAYNAAHVEERRQYSKQWRKSRIEWVRVYEAQYREENRELLRERRREYCRRNPDLVQQQWRRYRDSPRAKRLRAEYQRRREALQRSITASPVSYDAILARDGYICHICGGLVPPGNIHFDHVVPLARGGCHSEGNIKVAHESCNVRKGDKFLEEYLSGLEGDQRNAIDGARAEAD